MTNIVQQTTCNLRRRSDDPFFSEGYKLSLGGDSCVVTLIHHQHVKEDLKMTVTDPSLEDNNNNDLQQQQQQQQQQPLTFPCCSPGCSEIFYSMKECEDHYDKFHTKVCHICKAIFPTDHLLDLHIEELHDSYFQTALEQKRVRLSCLVSTCFETFENDKDRLYHLREFHNYPRWFRFHPRSKLYCNNNNNNKNNENQHPTTNKKKQSYSKKQWTNESVNNTLQNHKTDSNTTNKMTMELNDTITICPLAMTKKAARKKRQKQKRALIPCKFYTTKDGCRHGEKCMFLHSKNNNNKEAMNHNDQEMGVLTQQMRQVSIPDKISFGRGKRR